jgi:PKD repeat protein
VSADPVAGKPVAFDGSASSDPGGAIGAYRWDFGDGATATGAKPTHVYRASGRYTVTLTVADDDALTGATAKTLSVAVLPALSKLKVSPRTFVAAGGGASIARRRKAGTTVTYRDSHASKTTFTVRRAKAGVRKGGRCVKRPRRSTRRRKRCTRFVAVGRFAHKDRAGKNKFRFTGRVRRHKLAPGRYRLEAVSRFAGRSGPRTTKGFHVVHRRAASKN